MAGAQAEAEMVGDQQDNGAEGEAIKFQVTNQSRRVSDTPIFKRHHESSTIELFYDLFFVANLTIFTATHEINSPTSEDVLSECSTSC